VLAGSLVHVTILDVVAKQPTADDACDGCYVTPCAMADLVAKKSASCSADDRAYPKLMIALQLDGFDLHHLAIAYRLLADLGHLRVRCARSEHKQHCDDEDGEDDAEVHFDDVHLQAPDQMIEVWALSPATGF